MWTIIKTFVAPHIGRILMSGVLIAAVTSLWAITYNAGAKAEQAKAVVKQTKIVRKVHAIEDKNRAVLRDGAAAKRLLDEWSRDR